MRISIFFALAVVRVGASSDADGSSLYRPVLTLLTLSMRTLLLDAASSVYRFGRSRPKDSLPMPPEL
jgi:hypothetical protein